MSKVYAMRWALCMALNRWCCTLGVLQPQGNWNNLLTVIIPGPTPAGIVDAWQGPSYGSNVLFKGRPNPSAMQSSCLVVEER